MFAKQSSWIWLKELYWNDPFSHSQGRAKNYFQLIRWSCINVWFFRIVVTFSSELALELVCRLEPTKEKNDSKPIMNWKYIFVRLQLWQFVLQLIGISQWSSFLQSVVENIRSFQTKYKLCERDSVSVGTTIYFWEKQILYYYSSPKFSAIYVLSREKLTHTKQMGWEFIIWNMVKKGAAESRESLIFENSQ